jgi:hypothetical protein
MQVMLYGKGFIGFLIFVIGISFVSDINLHEAFTMRFKEFGGGLIFLGLLSWFTVVCQRWATDRHNRFMLVWCFCMDSIVLGSQYHLGRVVTSYTLPDYPSEMQLDCLKTVPVMFTAEECLPYFQSDRVAGMRLMWAHYYSDRNTKSSFQKITSIEGDLCCGFFAPLGCVSDPAPFPLDRDITGIPLSLEVSGVSYPIVEQRTLCGPVEMYYPRTDECLHYSDLSTVPPTIGGCSFDMGLGYCLLKELTHNSLGCASFVEDTMVASIETTGFMLAFLTLLNILAMLLECCMWWKRKETDVLPSIKTKGLRDIDYFMVQDQFEVRPSYEILAKKKFLPMPRHLKLELARLAEEKARVVAARLAEEAALEDEV